MRKPCVMVWLLACLLAPPALAEEEEARLLVLDIKAPRRDRGAARALTARLTHGLDDRLEVVTVYSAADLARLADLEVEKQKLGCDVETASCLTEIADAFGARFVSYGNIGTIGRARFLEVTIVDVLEARPVERIFLKGEDAGVLLEGLEQELGKSARALRDYLGVAAPAAEVVKKKRPAQRKSLARREAPVSKHTAEHLRRMRTVRTLEQQHAEQVGAAAAIFSVGGVTTGACLGTCGIGAIMGGVGGSPEDPGFVRTSTIGRDLMLCGGIGGGISLLTTLGFGLWKASEASETAEALKAAKRRVKRLALRSPGAMRY